MTASATTRHKIHFRWPESKADEFAALLDRVRACGVEPSLGRDGGDHTIEVCLPGDWTLARADEFEAELKRWHAECPASEASAVPKPPPPDQLRISGWIWQGKLQGALPWTVGEARSACHKEAEASFSRVDPEAAVLFVGRDGRYYTLNLRAVAEEADPEFARRMIERAMSLEEQYGISIRERLQELSGHLWKVNGRSREDDLL